MWACAPCLVARETGAQKWLRDPFSLNARVVKCSPAAMRFNVAAWLADGAAAAMHAVPMTCIR